MRYYYNPSADTFHEGDEAPTDGCVELDPVKAAMFVYAESRGQRVDRDRIDEFKLDPAADVKRAVEARRARRNAILTETDWTQLPDAFGGDAARKKAWAVYRQALRDLDMTGTDWPVQPAE